MTPRDSNPNVLDNKHPLSPDHSENSQQQYFDYLIKKKPEKKSFKIPIKEMLKSYSGLNFNEKHTPKALDPKFDKILHIYNLQKEEKKNWFNSLSYRGPEDHSMELLSTSPKKKTLLTQEEENSSSKFLLKNSFELNIATNTTNKIRKMLLTSPYNNSKALVNTLKSVKNLSHGSLLSDDLKGNKNIISNNFPTSAFSKQSKGFLNNFNFSRKNLIKLAASNNLGNKVGIVDGKNKGNNERNLGKQKESEGIIQEESTFKNSISYKSTHNTSKSADKWKDKQSEDLFKLFNRAKCLLSKYKIKEKEWKKEKEELLKEIENLKVQQSKGV